MKTRDRFISLYYRNIRYSILAFFSMVFGVYASYLAEPLEQETGLGTSMLGYNRDYLVNGRWWFVSGAILCVLIIYLSFNKILNIDRK